MATITKRKDGWYVQIRRQGYAPQFKTFKTKAEGQAWAREQEGLIDRQQAPLDLRSLRSITLADILRRYLDEVTPRKRSAYSEAQRLGKMIKAPMCALSLADLGAPAIAAYRDLRLETVMPGTIRRELSLLHHAIDVARREWGVGLTGNPVERVTRPVAHNERDRRLRPGDLARLEKALEKTRNPLIRPIVLFAIETALRRSELLALEWRHVDFIRRTAHIPKTKADRPRTIPLTDGALAILSGLGRTDERVFPTTEAALKHAWTRTRDRAGLFDLHLHDLRHEGISRFSEMGLNMMELALISGHRDVRMLSRYTHLRPSDLAQKLAGRSWVNEGAGR